jgi:hypothetical protein
MGGISDFLPGAIQEKLRSRPSCRRNVVASDSRIFRRERHTITTPSRQHERPERLRSQARPMGSIEGPSNTLRRAVGVDPPEARRSCCSRPCDHERWCTGHHGKGTQGVDQRLFQAAGCGRLRPAWLVTACAHFPTFGSIAAPASTAFGKSGATHKLIDSSAASSESRPSSRFVGDIALWRAPVRLKMYRLGLIGPAGLSNRTNSLDDTLIVAPRSRSEPKVQFFPIVNATTGRGDVQIRLPADHGGGSCD